MACVVAATVSAAAALPPCLPCSFNAYCPPQFLAWQYRYPRLLAELEAYAADLLFLQEVEESMFQEQLQPRLQQRGYSSLFHPRRNPQGECVRCMVLLLVPAKQQHVAVECDNVQHTSQTLSM